jgi:cytochrome b561
MHGTTGYSRAQIALHWIIAILIGANYFLGEGMGWALKQRIEAGAEPGTRASLHVWIGVAVLVLVLVRLGLRMTRGAPASPEGTPPLLSKLAGLGHLALYVLMIGVPLGGAVVWFLGLRSLGDVHALGGNLIMAVAGLHAVAALFHQYVLKDRLLVRMMRAE